MKRTTAFGKIFDIGNSFLLGIFMFICIYPFYYVLIYSFSNPSMDLQNVFIYPIGFSLATHKGIFVINDIFNAFFISLSRTILGTLITLLFSSLFAYLIIKKGLPYRKLIYRFLVISLYLNAGLIPWYLTMKAYGLRNSFLLYIVPGAIQAYFVILIKTYFESLPSSIEESAMIDGAGFLTIYAKIIVPISMPILATIAVFAAVGQWNSWNDNFFLVSESKLQTLQLVLYNYLSNAQNIYTSITTQDVSMQKLRNMVSPQTIRMAITAVATLPILFAYPFLQRYFVKGIMLGAIKG